MPPSRGLPPVILPRHKSDPCGELPSRAKMAAVVDCGDKRRCDHRSNVWQPREPPARFVRSANSRKLSIELLEPEVEATEFIEHVAKKRPCEIGQFGVRHGVARLRQERPCALRQNH